MKKEKILITVEGGIVQSICSTNPNLQIAIDDYDKHSDDPVCVATNFPFEHTPNIRECFKFPLDAMEQEAYDTLDQAGFFNQSK